MFKFNRKAKKAAIIKSKCQDILDKLEVMDKIITDYQVEGDRK